MDGMNMKVDFEIKDRYTIADLLRIMELLRSENGCPWDREAQRL